MCNGNVVAFAHKTLNGHLELSQAGFSTGKFHLVPYHRITPMRIRLRCMHAARIDVPAHHSRESTCHSKSTRRQCTVSIYAVNRQAVEGQTTARGEQKETFGTGSAAQSEVCAMHATMHAHHEMFG